MDRENILAKSRSEGQDEGLRHAQDVGRRIAWRGGYFALVLVLWQSVTTMNYGTLAIVMAIIVGYNLEYYLPIWQFTRKKSHFAIVAFCALLFPALLMLYVALTMDLSPETYGWRYVIEFALLFLVIDAVLILAGLYSKTWRGE